MAIILPFHARISAGYKSGLSSWRGMPDTRSTAITRSGGTSSHCETACMVMPSDLAKLANPPAARIARSNAFLPLSIAAMSSTTLQRSQAPLHSDAQAMLYNADMTLGNRIKTARERLRPELSQADLGKIFKISGKAVSGWERDETIPTSDKLPQLRRALKVTYIWLLEGKGVMPLPDDPAVLLDDLAPADRVTVEIVIHSLHGKHRPAA